MTNDADETGPRRRDLEAAAGAASLEPRRILGTDAGDGTEQLVALGPPPAGRPAIAMSLLGLAAMAAVGSGAAYAVDAPRQWEGGLLAVALLLVGLALVYWSKNLLPETLAIELRAPLDEGDHDALADDLGRPEIEQPGRRRLVIFLAGSGAAIAGAATFPVWSLGPSPGDSLATTSWRGGLRLVDADGVPVHRDDIAEDGSLTVFPEGHTEAGGDSQVMLVRVPADLLSAATVAGGAVEGRVAYSKVCTHAGCPVGQFRVDSRMPTTSYQLLCPCHQSLFDVLDGCRVLAGPAATPLPQLPIAVDADGYLVATGDFPVPIGPSYWDRR